MRVRDIDFPYEVTIPLGNHHDAFIWCSMGIGQSWPNSFNPVWTYIRHTPTQVNFDVDSMYVYGFTDPKHALEFKLKFQ